MGGERPRLTNKRKLESQRSNAIGDEYGHRTSYKKNGVRRKRLLEDCEKEGQKRESVRLGKKKKEEIHWVST